MGTREQMVTYAVRAMVSCNGDDKAVVKQLKKTFGLSTTGAKMVLEEASPEIEAAMSGYYESQRNSNEVVKTLIVGDNSRKSASSSFLRGAVGGAVLGPVGAIAGAVSGKNVGQTIFQVIYADGHSETKYVKTGSAEFERLCKYL